MYTDPSGLRQIEAAVIEKRSHYDKETNTLRTGTRMDRYNNPKVARENTERQQDEIIEQVPDIVSDMVDFAGTTAGVAKLIENASTAAIATSGAMTKNAGIIAKSGPWFFGAGVIINFALVANEKMTPAEAILKTAAGLSGFINPAIGIVATLAVDEAFKNKFDEQTLQTTDNMSDLSDYLGGTLDWLETQKK
ncbi:MAG: hypothetical protein JEY99_11925 [Spirochaetales bacterium]|nr:hypothetical protein [Spirochaetales bacterium]